MTDFPEIGYGVVHGRFLAGVLDDKDPVVNPAPPGFEPEVAPDAEPLSGYVTFSATAPVVRVVGATPAPATLFPQSLRVYLDDEGYLSRDGSRDITLWATDDPDGNPVNWQWRVTFSLDHKGHGVYHAPFNFELPTDSIVDLTVVAPLVTPSPGTIIIQGPPGVDGAFDASIIDAKGDLLVGSGPDAFDILPVGPEGTALTPDPAAPLGLSWQAVVAGGGFKTYADRAALDAVRESEVGLFHTDNLAVEFPNLAAAGSGVEYAFGTQGAADLIVTTVKTALTSLPGVPLYVQFFEIGYISDAIVRVQRTWSAGQTPPAQFEGVANIPSSKSGQNQYVLGLHDTAVNQNKYQKIFFQSDAWAQPGTLIMRNGVTGLASIMGPPVNPEHIPNKQYVDDAIGAIPPPSGGTKVYNTEAELDAETVPGFGVLHVTTEAEWPTVAYWLNENVDATVEITITEDYPWYAQRIHLFNGADYERDGGGPGEWSDWTRLSFLPGGGSAGQVVGKDQWGSTAWIAPAIGSVGYITDLDNFTDAGNPSSNVSRKGTIASVNNLGVETGVAALNGLQGKNLWFESRWTTYTGGAYPYPQAEYQSIEFVYQDATPGVIHRSRVTLPGQFVWDAWTPWTV